MQHGPLLQVPSTSHEPVGLVGASDRHPGGSVDFWNSIEGCLDFPRTVPLQRWNVDTLHSQKAVMVSGVPVRLSSFVEDIDTFDNYIFKLTPAEACAMDPQLRLLLEHSLMSMQQGQSSIGRLFDTKTGVHWYAMVVHGHDRLR